VTPTLARRRRARVPSATEVNLMAINITKVEKIEATRIHLTPGELA
jgi:hypothetical protein